MSLWASGLNLPRSYCPPDNITMGSREDLGGDWATVSIPGQTICIREKIEKDGGGGVVKTQSQPADTENSYYALISPLAKLDQDRNFAMNFQVFGWEIAKRYQILNRLEKSQESY